MKMVGTRTLQYFLLVVAFCKQHHSRLCIVCCPCMTAAGGMALACTPHVVNLAA